MLEQKQTLAKAAGWKIFVDLDMTNSFHTRRSSDLYVYCKKSSYNTALSGNYTSTDMIKYVLGRGCLTIVTVVTV